MDILENRSPTLTTTHYGEPVVCYGFDSYNMAVTGDVAKTLNSAATDTDHIPVVCYNSSGDGFKESQTMYTLNTTEVHGVAYVYDARGNGGGAIVPTLTGDHENRITDYTAIAVEVKR